ncbi:MAG: hypothetical protein ACFFBP_06960 [Promethearchaeota archaeon]
MINIQKYLEIYEKYKTGRTRYEITHDESSGYRAISNEKIFIYRRKKIELRRKIAYMLCFLPSTIIFLPLIIIPILNPGDIGLFFIALLVWGIFNFIFLIALLHDYFRIRVFVFGPDGLVYKYIIGNFKYCGINQIKNVEFKYIKERWDVVGLEFIYKRIFAAEIIMYVDLIKKNGSNKVLTISNCKYETNYAYY